MSSIVKNNSPTEIIGVAEQHLSYMTVYAAYADRRLYRNQQA